MPSSVLHWALAIAWSLVVVTMAVVAPRPVVDNSVGALLDARSPRVAAYRRFQTAFGSDELIVARAEGGSPYARLRWTQTVTSTLAAQPSVQGVLSVTSLHPEQATVILDEIFGGPQTLAERADELASPVARKLGLWAADGANIYGFATVSAPEARAELAARLDALRARAATDGVRLLISGPPLLNLALDRAGRQTERTALPALLSVCIVLLLAMTGSVRGTIALIGPIGLTVLAIDGAFATAGGVTNILVNIAKPLLFVIGLASAVHVYFEARALTVRGMDDGQAPFAAARRKALPVTIALLTTAVGFGSLSLSSVAPIRSFGTVVGLGLMAMTPSILLTIPLLLYGLRRPRPTPGPWATTSANAVVKGAERLVEASLRRPWIGPSICVLVIALGAAAFPRLRPEPHAIRYFSPDHPLRRDQTRLEAAGLGVATLEAIVSCPQITRDPAMIEPLSRLAEAAAASPAVAAVVGWPDLAREIQSATGRPDIDDWTLRRLAERPEAAAFGQGDQARLSVLLKTVDAEALNRLKATLRDSAARLFNCEVELTGNYDLLVHAQAALLETIQVSLLWTAALMELILLVVLRSVRLGAVALLPNLFPVALNVALMALLDVPLDLATSMTAAIALGIAVDDTLHFILAAHRTPLSVAARSAGAAIITSSVVIGSGFAALMGADFLPTVRFGGLCALAMLSALIADLVVLPPLLRWARSPDDH